MTPISFPRTSGPVVSILMVTYTAWDWTRLALEAVLTHTDVPYDVTIVDNASPDGTDRSLRAEVRGARLIFNDENLGFGPAMNQAALYAEGEYLCFLNSDAVVSAGWIQPLVEVLAAEPGIGAVAPKLLNPDGTLQEAGCLLGDRADVALFGFGEDPGEAQYSFRRDVSYASAACLVVRRRQFLELGGFDPAFAPAYYEDVDLCLQLSNAGFRVVYEPRSEVVHAQSASTPEEYKLAQVERNAARIRERWAHHLRLRPPIGDLDRLPHRKIASRDAGIADRFLVVHSPGIDASVVDAVTTLRRLWPAARHTHLASTPADAALLRDRLGLEVEILTLDGNIRAWSEARRFHYSVVFDACAGGLAEVERSEIASGQPQAQWVSLGAGAHAAAGMIHLDLDAADVDVMTALAPLGVAPPSLLATP